jgi:hypothetical protein
MMGACSRSQSPLDEFQVNQPLSSFEQEITSTTSQLRLQPNQTFQLGVNIKNNGHELWVSKGNAPIVVSYKWFEAGKMLPIEGERTILPRPLRFGESAPVEVRVVAPPQRGQLTLIISLVQESVAWFMAKGGKPLRIPVELN